MAGASIVLAGVLEARDGPAVSQCPGRQERVPEAAVDALRAEARGGVGPIAVDAGAEAATRHRRVHGDGRTRLPVRDGDAERGREG